MSDGNPIEIWKPVKGHEERYSVSSLGRVRRDAGGRGATPGRILKPGTAGDGYAMVQLYVNDVTKMEYVHRLVMATFHGEHEYKKVVHHKNGDRKDNRLVNLEWVTTRENVKRSYESGRRVGHKKWGSKTHKLTAEKVIEIRRQAERGVGFSEIAETFGISKQYVSKVANGGSWKHV